MCPVRYATAVAFAALLAVSMAMPQKDGAIYSNEAIRQAQNTLLIPKNANIEKVQEGIEVAAYEKIPGPQRIELFQILGDLFPMEVINNLQGQIDKIGRQ